MKKKVGHVEKLIYMIKLKEGVKFVKFKNHKKRCDLTIWNTIVIFSTINPKNKYQIFGDELRIEKRKHTCLP